MPNVTMKAPAGIAMSTTIILADGTSTQVDASGYISIDAKHVAAQLAAGFLPVTNVNDTMPAHKYVAMINTTAVTIPEANLVAEMPVIHMTGTLGAGAALTMPTVAQLVAAIPQWSANMTVRMRVINASAGAFAWTLTLGTGFTMTGTMTIAQNTWRDFVVTFQSATTATVQQVGTGTNS